MGKRLAARLNVLYLDREIVSQAAKELKMSAEALESRDEKLTPIWQSLLESYMYAASGLYTGSAQYADRSRILQY